MQFSDPVLFSNENCSRVFIKSAKSNKKVSLWQLFRFVLRKWGRWCIWGLRVQTALVRRGACIVQLKGHHSEVKKITTEKRALFYLLQHRGSISHPSYARKGEDHYRWCPERFLLQPSPSRRMSCCQRIRCRLHRRCCGDLASPNSRSVKYRKFHVGHHPVVGSSSHCRNLHVTKTSSQECIVRDILLDSWT